MKYENVEVNSERWLELKPLLNEIFVSVEGYEGRYEISNYGRIKSMKRKYKRYNGYKICEYENKEKILSCSYNKKGYITISLYKNGNTKTYMVHRLVASHFLEKEQDDDVVNHIDCNKGNPRIDNLEYCSEDYNRQHARINDLLYKGRKIRNLETGEIYSNYKDMIKKLGITFSRYRYIMYGKNKKYEFIDRVDKISTRT